MEQSPALVIKREDFEKILGIISLAKNELGALLEEELGRAEIVSAAEFPRDRVAMNSRVVYKDMETGKESKVTVVFPHEANVDENKISILAPIGAALIGLRVGQEIHWPLPHGKDKRVKVISVDDHESV